MLERFRKLPRGKENAITKEKVATLLGITPQAVKAAARKARKAGIFVCSCNKGYYMPKDEREKQAFLIGMTQQGITRFTTISELQRQMKNIIGQEELHF